MSARARHLFSLHENRKLFIFLIKLRVRWIVCVPMCFSIRFDFELIVDNARRPAGVALLLHFIQINMWFFCRLSPQLLLKVNFNVGMCGKEKKIRLHTCKRPRKETKSDPSQLPRFNEIPNRYRTSLYSPPPIPYFGMRKKHTRAHNKSKRNHRRDA